VNSAGCGAGSPIPGSLEHHVARNAVDIRLGVEAFLSLEASGWKGRERTAMATDRYRAAFAREAVHRLAERDLCRIHTLTLDGKVIACLIVFIEAGIAYTWKTAYDEAYAAYSPGTLMMLDVTRYHLDDPNILGTDSCATADHPVMSRIWTERRPIGTMVVALTPDADRLARQAASQLAPLSGDTQFRSHGAGSGARPAQTLRQALAGVRPALLWRTAGLVIPLCGLRRRWPSTSRPSPGAPSG
jgi:hypothetical protein